MIKITSLRRTCIACPSQWEGRTDDDRPVYIRFRHGYLRVDVGAIGWATNLLEWPSGTLPFDKYKEVGYQYGYFEWESDNDMDGDMTFTELKEISKEKILFDCESQEEYHNEEMEKLLIRWLKD